MWIVLDEPLEDGEYSVEVWAYDNALNEAHEVWAFTVDTAITISNMSPTGSVNVRTPSISATVTGAAIDWEHIYMTVDYVSVSYSCNVTTGAVVYYPSEPLDDGLHIASLAGVTWEFVIDVPLPRLDSFFPSSGACVSFVPTISATVSAPDINFALSTATVDDGEPISLSALVAGYYDGGLADGWHVVSVHLVNDFGKFSDFSWEFLIDTTPPAITIVTPADEATVRTSLPYFHASILETGSGVSLPARVTIVDSLLAEYETYVYITEGKMWFCSLEELPNGDYTIAGELCDNAGNEAVWPEWEFSISDSSELVVTLSVASNAGAMPITVSATVKYLGNTVTEDCEFTWYAPFGAVDTLHPWNLLISTSANAGNFHFDVAVSYIDGGSIEHFGHGGRSVLFRQQNFGQGDDGPLVVSTKNYLPLEEVSEDIHGGTFVLWQVSFRGEKKAPSPNSIDDATLYPLYSDYVTDATVNSTSLNAIKPKYQLYGSMFGSADGTPQYEDRWVIWDDELDGYNRYPICIKSGSKITINAKGIKMLVSHTTMPVAKWISASAHVEDIDNYSYPECPLGHVTAKYQKEDAILVSGAAFQYTNLGIPAGKVVCGTLIVNYTVTLIGPDGEFTLDGWQSRNPFYATWDTPKIKNQGERAVIEDQITLQHTIVDIACRSANGITDPELAVIAIWEKFASLDVKHVEMDGYGIPESVTAMIYWRDGLSGTDWRPQQTWYLLHTGRGRCGAWGDLFRFCCKVLGIQGLRAAVIEPVAPQYDQLVVLNNASPGIPAQGDPTPVTKTFQNHKLIRWTRQSTGDKIIFDPSYGTVFSEGDPNEPFGPWQRASLYKVMKWPGVNSNINPQYQVPPSNAVWGQRVKSVGEEF